MANAKKLLVVGSIAFDHLMRFDGVFQEKILPEHLANLSVSFGASARKMSFGGCGGNIGFHLKKLGGEPLLYGLVGKDFDEYEKWFSSYGISTDRLSRKEGERTSAAFVVTDLNGNQIAIFDEGAAREFYEEEKQKFREMVVTHQSEIAAAIIAPTNAELMKFTAELCVELGIPYFFDPGQTIIQFSRQELRSISEKAFGLFTNQYEMQIFIKESMLSLENIERMYLLVVETLGEKGSLITFSGKRFFIEAKPTQNIVDPTGCGDAYRAAFLFEILKDEGFPKKVSPETIKRAATSGSSLASYVLGISGTQG